LTDFGADVLALTMRKTRAWELLNDPDYCGTLGMVDLYDLMLRAGYSEDAAQRAANERGNRRLDAGVGL
jgi:hypothetical protein